MSTKRAGTASGTLCAALVGAAVWTGGAAGAGNGAIFVETWDEEATAAFTLWRGGIDRPFRRLQNLQTEGKPCVSPDGRRVAYVSSRADVIVRRISPVADTVGPKKIIGRLPLERGSALVDCAWSPGGRAIALVGDGDVGGRSVAAVWRVQRDGSRLRELLQLKPGGDGSPDGHPAWSRKGRIAFVQPKSQPWITLVDADGGDPVRLRRHGHSPAWSPNGKQLAFIRSEAGEYEMFSSGPVVSVEADGSDRRVLRRGANGAVAFSTDGRRLAYATWNFGPGPFNRVTITARNGTTTHILPLPDPLTGIASGITWTKRTQ